MALIGPVGSLQNDSLSLWIVRFLSLAGTMQSSLPHGIRVVLNLLDWVMSLLPGGLALLALARWRGPLALVAAGGLAVGSLGLTVFLYASTGVLLTASAPILSIGFSLMTGYVLLKLPPRAYSTGP